jgi:fatty-acyl-CoA synthase
MERLSSSDTRLSCRHGAVSVPLVAATIGDIFDQVVSSQPQHEALVSRHQNLRYPTDSSRPTSIGLREG